MRGDFSHGQRRLKIGGRMGFCPLIFGFDDVTGSVPDVFPKYFMDWMPPCPGSGDPRCCRLHFGTTQNGNCMDWMPPCPGSGDPRCRRLHFGTTQNEAKGRSSGRRGQIFRKPPQGMHRMTGPTWLRDISRRMCGTDIRGKSPAAPVHWFAS